MISFIPYRYLQENPIDIGNLEQQIRKNLAYADQNKSPTLNASFCKTSKGQLSVQTNLK
jgi:hypothetical protein